MPLAIAGAPVWADAMATDHSNNVYVVRLMLEPGADHNVTHGYSRSNAGGKLGNSR
jgi:hypothetical protein